MNLSISGDQPPPAADRAAAELVELNLDELALTFAQHPRDVARLLTLHAANVITLDLAAVDDTAPHFECGMRAATADGTRAALLNMLGARPARTRNQEHTP